MPMNDATPPSGDHRWPWLAGYVDHELPEELRRAVEEWISTDPAVASVLAEQAEMSPQQRDFWDAVVPPQPSPTAWKELENQIRERLQPVEAVASRPRYGRLGIAAGVAIAASVALAWMLFPTKLREQDQIEVAAVTIPAEPEQAPPPREAAANLLEEYADLPVVRPGEVIIQSVRGEMTPVVVGPEQPVPNQFIFATVSDVAVEKMSPSTASHPDATGPVWKPSGSVPMIYAGLGR